MKNFYRILLILALALVLTVGAVSLVSWKQTEGKDGRATAVLTESPL